MGFRSYLFLLESNNFVLPCKIIRLFVCYKIINKTVQLLFTIVCSDIYVIILCMVFKSVDSYNIEYYKSKWNETKKYLS